MASQTVQLALDQLLENNRKDLQKYVCPSCNYLLRDAVQQMCCGHWLCECCAKELAGSDSPHCPRQDCLELWNIAEQPAYFPDRFVRKSLGKFSIKCTNEDCSWIGNVEQLTLHLAECELTKLQCEHCNELLVASEVKSHKEVCKGAKTLCLFAGLGCDNTVKITREELRIHLTEDLVGHFEIIAKLLEKVKAGGVLEEELEKDGRPSDHSNKALALMRSALPASHSMLGAGTTSGGYNSPSLPVKGLEMMVVTDGPEEGAVSGGNPAVDRYSRQEMLQQLLSDRQRRFQEITGFKTEFEYLKEQLSTKDSEIARLNSKVLQMEKQVQSKSSEGEDRDFRLSLIENSNYDGTMIWKIPQFSQRMEDARSGKYTSIFSLPFYSSRYGYKMCLRLYILGDGIGKNTHMSLFFVVMKGEFDAILQWPFTHKVSFRLINQHHGRDVVDVFQPDPMSSSFQRPKTDMNVASGCPRFISLAELNQGGFMEDNTIFIKVKVDVSTMKHI